MKRFFKISIPIILCCITGNLTCNAQTLSMLFAGDAMQHQAQLDDALQNDGTYLYYNNFDAIRAEVSSADIAIVNLETTLGLKPYSGYPAFCSPAEFAVALKRCGFDIFLTANNHCLDRGSKGVFRTIEILDSIGVKHLGTYKNRYERYAKYPLIVQKGDLKIGILNYTYGTNGIVAKQDAVVDYIDTILIKRDIAFCKIKNADIIIANIHWGEEYILENNHQQSKLANWIHKQGVRVIIGSHPHVVQPIVTEKYDNGDIKNITLYSLGNFISNMQTADTKGGIMFKINLVKEGCSVKIVNPRYTKIFTQRPIYAKDTPYALLPCDSTTMTDTTLSAKMRNDMLIFNNRVNELFNKLNTPDIKEYFFSKKGANTCTKQK